MVKTKDIQLSDVLQAKSTNNPKVVGSNPASGAAREKEKKIGNMVKKQGHISIRRTAS